MDTEEPLPQHLIDFLIQIKDYSAQAICLKEKDGFKLSKIGDLYSDYGKQLIAKEMSKRIEEEGKEVERK